MNSHVKASEFTADAHDAWLDRNRHALKFVSSAKVIPDRASDRFAVFNDYEAPVDHYMVFDGADAPVLALKEGCTYDTLSGTLGREKADAYLKTFQEQGLFAHAEPPAERIERVRSAYNAQGRGAGLRDDLEAKLVRYKADGSTPWSAFSPHPEAPAVEVSLLITDACNLRCRYCHVMDSDNVLPAVPKTGVMSEEVLQDFARTFIGFIKQRWGTGCLNVVFFGGQPSLRGKVRAFLFEAADYLASQAAREKVFIRFSIDDNGTQIDDELIAFFTKYDFDVSLSFDPPVAANDWQRPFPGKDPKSGATIEEGLRRLVQSDVRVGLRATVSDRNQDHVYESVVKYSGWGLRSASFIPMQDVAHGRTVAGVRAPDPAVLSQQYTRAFEHVLDLFEKTGAVFDFGPVTSILHRIANGGEIQTCGMGDVYFAVDPRGGAYSCHRDLTSDFFIGDVSEPACVDALLHPPLKTTCPQVTSFYDPSLFCSNTGCCNCEPGTPAACRDCPILAFCGGSCPAASFAHYGCTNIGLSVLVDSDPARGDERCRWSKDFVSGLFWRFIDEKPGSVFQRYLAALFGQVMP